MNALRSQPRLRQRFPRFRFLLYVSGGCHLLWVPWYSVDGLPVEFQAAVAVDSSDHRRVSDLGDIHLVTFRNRFFWP